MHPNRQLDPDDARPPYQQIAEAFRRDIAAGELGPGARLPSVTALANSYGVARQTVQHAMSQLREEGLVVLRQGSGTFVRARPLPDAESPAHYRAGRPPPPRDGELGHWVVRRTWYVRAARAADALDVAAPGLSDDVDAYAVDPAVMAGSGIRFLTAEDAAAAASAEARRGPQD